MWTYHTDNTNNNSLVFFPLSLRPAKRMFATSFLVICNQGNEIKISLLPPKRSLLFCPSSKTFAWFRVASSHCLVQGPDPEAFCGLILFLFPPTPWSHLSTKTSTGLEPWNSRLSLWNQQRGLNPYCLYILLKGPNIFLKKKQSDSETEFPTLKKKKKSKW